MVLSVVHKHPEATEWRFADVANANVAPYSEFNKREPQITFVA
jgi:hypothetical protein